jgi:hypothetical protein
MISLFAIAAVAVITMPIDASARGRGGYYGGYRGGYAYRGGFRYVPYGYYGYASCWRYWNGRRWWACGRYY